MKIEANQIKVGQTVKRGNRWMVVDHIAVEVQKNGKKLVRCTGTSVAGKVRGDVVESQSGYDMTFRFESMVPVK